MPKKLFVQGNPGRPKGAKNKKPAELREFLAMILDDNKEKFKRTLEGLRQMEYVKAYLDLLNYTLPKLKAVEHRNTPDLEAFLLMTPIEQEALLNELKSQLNNEH